MVVETISKATLLFTICGYTLLGTMVDTTMSVGDWSDSIESYSHNEVIVPKSTLYYGSPAGLVIRAEKSIEPHRTYISIANRSGKWLSCDFGDGKVVNLTPDDKEMQLLPMPVDIETKQMPTCLGG